MLWIVDYTNPSTETLECLIIEEDSYDDAKERAIRELKCLQIPKRYIVRMEVFDG